MPLAMVIGGYNNGNVYENEIVDFRATKNSTIPEIADLPRGMYGLVANLVGDKVIACGGYRTSSCYSYNFLLKRWAKTTSLDRERKGHVGFVSADGQWYISGGRDYSSSPDVYLDTTIIYKDGAFTAGQITPYPAYFPCTATVNETHIFYAGGYDGEKRRKDAYLLEVATWTWTSLEDMAIAREYHSCGKIDNDIVVVGGYAFEDAEKTSEIFNLETHSWRAGPGVPTESGQFWLSQVYQLENTFYLMGGYDGHADIDAIFELDIESSTWKKREESLGRARGDHAVVAMPTSILPFA